MAASLLGDDLKCLSSTARNGRGDSFKPKIAKQGCSRIQKGETVSTKKCPFFKYRREKKQKRGTTLWE